MTNPTRKTLTTVVALLALAFGAHGASAACLDNRQIQEAVASGEIMSLAGVLRSAGVDSDSDILSVQVCDQGGRLVYVIGVLSSSGEARTLEVDAR